MKAERNLKEGKNKGAKNPKTGNDIVGYFVKKSSIPGGNYIENRKSKNEAPNPKLPTNDEGGQLYQEDPFTRWRQEVERKDPGDYNDL